MENYPLWVKQSASANGLILKLQVSRKSCFPSTAHWNGDGMEWSKGICFLMRQNEMYLNWGMDGNEGKIQSVPHFYILRKPFSSWAEQNYTHAQNVPSRIQNSWANYFQLSWNHSIASMISVEGKNDEPQRHIFIFSINLVSLIHI